MVTSYSFPPKNGNVQKLFRIHLNSHEKKLTKECLTLPQSATITGVSAVANQEHVSYAHICDRLLVNNRGCYRILSLSALDEEAFPSPKARYSNTEAETFIQS